MIQIFCDICGESRKFRCSLREDFCLWFTTIEMAQICEKDKNVPMNSAVLVCGDCRDELLDGGREGLNINEMTPAWDRFDDCLIRELRQSLERKRETNKVTNPRN